MSHCLWRQASGSDVVVEDLWRDDELAPTPKVRRPLKEEGEAGYEYRLCSCACGLAGQDETMKLPAMKAVHEIERSNGPTVWSLPHALRARRKGVHFRNSAPGFIFLAGP